MKHNPLIEILGTFSKKEMTRYRDFVHSPYFNKHEDTKRLVDYLAHIYPDFSEKRCDRYRIFQKLFPKKKHHQSNLALLFTYAYRLLEKFLIEEQLTGQAIQKQLALLTRYRQEGHFEIYEKKFKKIHQHKGVHLQKDTDFYLQEFLIASELNKYNGQRSKLEKDQSIREKQDNLDHFYLSEKLKDACEVTVRKRILQSAHDIDMIDPVLVEVTENASKYQDNPSIQMYLALYEMLTNEDEDFYFEALRTAQLVEHQLPFGDWQNIYNYLQNYCIEKINKGHSSFLGHLFEIYKVQIEKELIFDASYLLEWHYKNIVTVGLRLQSYDWVHTFIENYQTRIRPESRQNAYTYNLAAYYYETKQYQEVLQLLLQVEYTDPRYYLGAKAMLLKTYFDLQEYEALDALTDAFRQYLSRSRVISDQRKKGYINLFKYTRKLLYWKTNEKYTDPAKSKSELEKLKLDIQSEAVFNKGWLMERVELV